MRTEVFRGIKCVRFQHCS